VLSGQTATIWSPAIPASAAGAVDGDTTETKPSDLSPCRLGDLDAQPLELAPSCRADLLVEVLREIEGTSVSSMFFSAPRLAVLVDVLHVVLSYQATRWQEREIPALGARVPEQPSRRRRRERRQRAIGRAMRVTLARGSVGGAWARMPLFGSLREPGAADRRLVRISKKPGPTLSQFLQRILSMAGLRDSRLHPNSSR
jgi:hypothetical protein